MPDEKTASRKKIMIALAVHLYTSTGAVLAFFTLISASLGRIAESFMLLFVSTVIDYSDGSIARRVHVREVLPSIEGDKLDSIIDFINNTLIPTYILWSYRKLPEPVSIWACFIILVGVLRYSTIDGPEIEKGLFKGLPTPWLFITFYFFYLSLSDTVMILVMLTAAILCFSSLQYIHIARFDKLTYLSLMFLSLWWLSYLMVSQNWARNEAFWISISLLFPLYYLLTPYYIHRQRQLIDRAGKI